MIIFVELTLINVAYLRKLHTARIIISSRILNKSLQHDVEHIRGKKDRLLIIILVFLALVD